MMTFLDYYRENLNAIRHLGADFAAEFPKIAARLELSGLDCQDPYVERILEGTAFLAARVEKKLESGFPRLLESILASVSPQALYPVPSYTILQLDAPSANLAQSGVSLPAGSPFHCPVPEISAECIFSTMRSVALLELEISETSYLTRELEKFNFKEPGIQAALYLKIKVTRETPAARLLDELPIYLNFPDRESALIQKLLLVDCPQIYLGRGDGIYRPAPQLEIELPMLRNSFPDSKVRSLFGLQTLQRFLVYPALYKFINIRHLGRLSGGDSARTIELVFPLKRRESTFLHALNVDNFKLNCVPAVNVFAKHSNRTVLSGDFEYHVVPERTAPRNYEIFKVLSTTMLNDRNEELFNCQESYRGNSAQLNVPQNYFVVHRQESLVNDNRSARSSYAGTEVFLSFAGKNFQDSADDVRQFQADLLCTNRDLPLLVHADAVLQYSAAGQMFSATFAAPPSSPSRALISRGTSGEWKKIGHIVFNLSSVLWESGSIPLQAVRELIKSYSAQSPEETEKLADGIVEIRTKPKIFRFIERGSVFFEDGWQIDMTLNEEFYADVGYFTFAAVLRELFESYTPLNSCAELTIHTKMLGHLLTWNLQGK